MMKIIDEKGKLFGKINVIDFLVVLFLFCLMPMFYFGYKIFSKKSLVVEDVTGVQSEIEMDFRFIKLEPEISKLIAVGDKEYNPKGAAIGEIIGLEEVLPYQYKLDVGDTGGKRIIKDDPVLKQVMARLRLNVVLKNDKVYYKNNILEINRSLKFKTNRYEVTAIPILIPEFKIFEHRYLNLYINLKGLDKEVIPLIGKGDREVDKDGEVIAEILNIGKITDHSFIINLGSGNFTEAYDAYKKQMKVRIALKCQIDSDNQIYFKGKKIGYNSPVEFNTVKYKANGIITQAFGEKWISVQVKFTGVIPEVAKIVEKGDIERDLSGDVSGKVSSVVSNKQSEVLILKENEFINLKHPFLKDILLWLDLLCLEKEGSYYFKNGLIKIGNTITFVSDIYSLSGVIIGLEIK